MPSPSRPGQIDRKFDAIRTVLLRLDILRVLLGGQNLFQQIAQLNLAPRAARLHIRQNFFQIADANRQRLHFAQTFMNLFEPVTNQFE